MNFLNILTWLSQNTPNATNSVPAQGPDPSEQPLAEPLHCGGGGEGSLPDRAEGGGRDGGGREVHSQGVSALLTHVLLQGQGLNLAS